ncbi:MAG: hypothetical protein NTW28_14110 [Candidatus Solibacter sp.]|nr:hypothetical protein [Candidatus Solibacter sp.]
MDESDPWSGSVSDDFQFGGPIYRGEELIDPRHRRLFQFGIPALAALKYRERPEDHDRGITDFEGQIRDPRLQ